MPEIFDELVDLNQYVKHTNPYLASKWTSNEELIWKNNI